MIITRNFRKVFYSVILLITFIYFDPIFAKEFKYEVLGGSPILLVEKQKKLKQKLYKKSAYIRCVRVRLKNIKGFDDLKIKVEGLIGSSNSALQNIDWQITQLNEKKDTLERFNLGKNISLSEQADVWRANSKIEELFSRLDRTVKLIHDTPEMRKPTSLCDRIMA